MPKQGCWVCDDEFDSPRVRASGTCSRSCYLRAYRALDPQDLTLGRLIFCEVCDDEVVLESTGRSTRRFCSDACRQWAYRQRVRAAQALIST